MQSKNRPAMTIYERAHVDRVKALPCACCDAPPPSEAHHVAQHSHFLVVPLCVECHRGPILGWHGQKRAWAVRKLTELDAIARTIEALSR